MRPIRATSLAANNMLVYGLTFLITTAAAYGDDNEHHNGGANANGAVIEYPPTYFAHTEHAGLMYAHIVLMVMSWIVFLPVGMLDSPRSKSLHGD